MMPHLPSLNEIRFSAMVTPSVFAKIPKEDGPPHVILFSVTWKGTLCSGEIAFEPAKNHPATMPFGVLVVGQGTPAAGRSRWLLEISMLPPVPL